MGSPAATSRSTANCVSRCAEMAQLPRWPGMAVPSTCPGPKAMVRPLAPASTMAEARCRGNSMRATGQVSAQLHGFTSRSPRSVRDEARVRRHQMMLERDAGDLVAVRLLRVAERLDLHPRPQLADARFLGGHADRVHVVPLLAAVRRRGDHAPRGPGEAHGHDERLA